MARPDISGDHGGNGIRLNEDQPKTNAQKRRAVEGVLIGADGERLLNRQAAARAGVSHHLVQLVRQERAMEK
jgi:hypothetical protein